MLNNRGRVRHANPARPARRPHPPLLLCATSESLTDASEKREGLVGFKLQWHEVISDSSLLYNLRLKTAAAAAAAPF